MTMITAEDFLKRTGMDEPMAPGQVKYRQHVAEKEGNSYTVVYDWHSNLSKIRVEIRPGLSGDFPEKRELSKYAVWLQTQNYLELDLSGQGANLAKEQQNDALSAMQAACEGKPTVYQMMATKVTKTLTQIGERINQIPIAVEGAKQLCRVLSKSFHKAGAARTRAVTNKAGSVEA